jgi:hypothetical protein
MKRQVKLVLAAVTVLVACDGFKEALTAHVDVVAKAGSQELSVNRLAELLGGSQIPLQKEVARSLADLWVNYQLLGVAAAHDDSLTDPKVVDDAMWSAIANVKAQKWYDKVKAGFPAGAAGGDEASYNSGQLLAAQHILFRVPEQGVTAKTKDSLAALARAQANNVRSQVTSANFADMAKKYSQDGSKDQGGSLGLFPHGAMVPEFEKAVIALKPGEISPVIQSQFGYHIIRRQTYPEVAEQFSKAMEGRGAMVAESTYLAKLEETKKVEVKANGVTTARAIAKDLESHRDDKSVIASWKGGELTAQRFARWIGAFPPQAQIRPQLLNAPDSMVPKFIKQIARNELILQQADSAKIAVDTADLNGMRRAFGALVGNVWAGLGVAPKMLADSAKTAAEKERLAATRVEGFLDKLLQQKVQFVEVPNPLEIALRNKYEAKVNDAGIDRVIERAQKIRAAADSVRASQQPPSAVPMPGAAPRPAQPPAPAKKP